MKNNNSFSFFSIIFTLLAIALFILAFWGVTYTADWASYEKSFEYELERRDLAFGFIGRVMNSLGHYDYQSVYRAHVVLMGALFPIFISRWQKNPLWVSAIFIVLSYVALANQIRYYVAFPLALFGLKALICDRNWFMFSIFSILAFVFHSSTLFFIIVVLIFYKFIFRSKRIESNIIVVNLFLFLIASFGLSYIIPLLGEFSFYLTADNQISSIVGGVYSALPSIIAFSLVLITHHKLKKKNPDCVLENSYRFLFVLSVASSLLLTLSFRTQIIGHRFINPLLLIWLLYFLCVSKNHRFLKQLSVLSIIVIVFMVISWQTYVPYYLGISDSIIDPELILTLNSIEFE